MARTTAPWCPAAIREAPGPHPSPCRLCRRRKQTSRATCRPLPEQSQGQSSSDGPTRSPAASGMCKRDAN
eukprot:7315754-Prymnesium_polylepis.2